MARVCLNCAGSKGCGHIMWWEGGTSASMLYISVVIIVCMQNESGCQTAFLLRPYLQTKFKTTSVNLKLDASEMPLRFCLFEALRNLMLSSSSVWLAKHKFDFQRTLGIQFGHFLKCVSRCYHW